MGSHRTDHIAIVAGGGNLPELLISACEHTNRPYTVIALSGHADSLSAKPKITASIGEASRHLSYLQSLGVKSIVMAGKVTRPHLNEFKFNWANIVFLFWVAFFFLTDRGNIGDDRLLRTVIKVLESSGLVVVGIEDILEELTAEEGSLTKISSSTLDCNSIQLGISEAKSLGMKDLGQAVVVQDHRVIGSENSTGTDALIRSCAHKGNLSTGPILVKVLKPIQDRRVDLPVIGPETVSTCINSGFRGIVIESKGTIIIQKDLVVKLANDNGLFIDVISCCDNNA
jgi:DUF1009 family protein